MTEADRELLATHIGRYELVRMMATGGMGELYLGHDPGVGRPVVLKLLQDRFTSKDARQRFEMEGRAAGRLRHKNIVTVFDVGEWQSRSWIAMEFISGETLAEKIGRRAQMSLTDRLRYIEELCSGLDFAHRNGVIHRDVKPHNVMVDDEDQVKILDFGIAHVVESNVTASGVLIGTPNYMAPEQVTGGAIDARTDVFAVGAVFYELLSYHRAFSGDLVTSVHRIVYEEPTPLAQLTPSLEPSIIRIVERALQKDPERRYPNLRSMAAEIEAARLSLDIALSSHTEIVARASAESFARTAVLSTAARASTIARRMYSGRARFIAAALLVTSAIGAGFYAYASRRPTGPATIPSVVAPPSASEASTEHAASTVTPSPPTTPPSSETPRPSALSTVPAPTPARLDREPPPTAPATARSDSGTPIPDARSAPLNVERLGPDRPVPETLAPPPAPSSAAEPLPNTPSPPAQTASSLASADATAVPSEEPKLPLQQGVTPQAPPSSAAPAVDDRAAIEEVLNEYRRAYEARDLVRVQRVFPALPSPAAVETAFAEAREVLVGMSPPTITVTSPTSATAGCRLNQNFVPRVGAARTAPTRNVTFTLRKDGNRWIIVSLR